MEDETIEYEEVVDFKKIGLIVTILILGSIITAVYIFGMDFPNIDLTQPKNESVQQPITEGDTQSQIDPRIRNDYKKYIEFGLSQDDILNIQELPCEAFETPENFSQEPKYELIFQQRQSECAI